MRRSIPPRPTGSDTFAHWAQVVHDRLFGREANLVDSPTATWNQTANGISINASGGGAAGGTVLIACVVTELFNKDYFGVTKYDPTTEQLQGSQFNCAKCITARQSAGERIDGEKITYDNYGMGSLPENNSDNTRLAHFGVINQEWQVMHPRYLEWPPLSGATTDQFILYVSKTSRPTGVIDADGKNLNWIEVQPNRFWSYSPYLNGGND